MVFRIQLQGGNVTGGTPLRPTASLCWAPQSPCLGPSEDPRGTWSLRGLGGRIWRDDRQRKGEEGLSSTAQEPWGRATTEDTGPSLKHPVHARTEENHVRTQTLFTLDLVNCYRDGDPGLE